MPKTKKELLQELLDLENSNIEPKVAVLEEIEEPSSQENNQNDKTQDYLQSENEKDKEEKITATKTRATRAPELNGEKVYTKRERTPKQIEAFKKAQKIRDDNALKRIEERKKKEEEEKKILEEKLVKKAIAIKKKQIKKQQVLDELSDDDTPVTKSKVLPLAKTTENKEQKSKSNHIEPPIPKYLFNFI
jgi:hypothetical protein